jgi:hypothetical protein
MGRFAFGFGATRVTLIDVLFEQNFFHRLRRNVHAPKFFVKKARDSVNHIRSGMVVASSMTVEKI